MRITIDRQVRDALYDACRSSIEGVSNLRIDDAKERDTLLELWARLSLLAPILDQIGWEQVTDRESFSVSLNGRRMRPFVRRDIEGLHDVLRYSVSTEDELRASVADEVANGWREPLSDAEWREELAWMQASVDRELDLITAMNRFLRLVERPPRGEVDDLEAVA